MKKSIYIKPSRTRINEIIGAVLVMLTSIAYLLGFKIIGFVVLVVYVFYYCINVLKDNI